MPVNDHESTQPAMSPIRVRERPVELLQRLIRFDTTSPPGNEAECIGFIAGLLADAGCPATLLARDAARPNLVARLEGEGKAPPLLLYGHVDVVTTQHQPWRHPPFAGDVVDGYVWGRGALDMKGGVAMFLSAFLRAKSQDRPLAGDVILTLVSDEEQGGEYGAEWLVANHADLFHGVRYALGEFGGFSLTVRGRRFYPLMVAEKHPCLAELVVTGRGGHGSLAVHGGVAERLGTVLQQLTTRHLPTKVTPLAREMFASMADVLPFPAGLALRALLRPRLTNRVLGLLGEQGEMFDPLLHDTVNVTEVRAGEQLWGVPSRGTVALAGSLLPGSTAEQFTSELRQLVGPEPDITVTKFVAFPDRLDLGLFGTLAEVLAESDPEGVVVPMLFPSPTDGRHFSRLGIQTYGFLPMRLPPELPFAKLAHGPDERIPAEAVTFGADTVYRVLQRYGRGDRTRA